MKYVDEFRDPLKAQFLLVEIRELVARIQVGRQPSPVHYGSLRWPYTRNFPLWSRDDAAGRD